MKRALLALALAACDGDSTSGPDAPGGGGDGGGGVDAAIDAPGSMGCGAAGAATGQTTETITVGGVARTYLRVVPATYDPARTYPLIFAWHGRTGSAMGARSYFGVQTAVGDNAIVVYPQGLSVSQDPADTGWILTAAGRDVALYDAIQTAVTTTYCVGRTYSMGHSFGGYMSNALACHRGGTSPGKVRAIASIAGGPSGGTCTGEPMSALVIHGMSDSVVPFTQGTASRDAYLAKAACGTTTQAITPSPCVAYDGCTAGLAIRFCAHSETAGGGHGWPSFAAGAAWKLFQDSP